MSHNRQLFSDAEYRRAYDEFFELAIEGIIGNDPILGNLEKRKTRHSGHLRTYFEQPWDQHPIRTQVTYTFSRKEVRQADLSAHRLVVACIAERFLIEQVRNFSTYLAEGAKRAGRLLAGNPQLTWEAVLEALEGVEMTFDADGNPNEFQIWCGVQARRSLDASQKPADYEEREKAIIDRKREEWIAAKRTRRLPR